RHWTTMDWSDVAPSLGPSEIAEVARYYRRAASPGAAVALQRMNTHVDVRAVLPTIRVPTVIMHRTDDPDAKVEAGRVIASKIPGACFVEFAGAAHSWWTQDRDATLAEIEELVTGVRPAPEPDRILATVLFTDIVESTRRVRELGDHWWAELLARHHAVVRRELERFRGRQVDTAGDGFLATFDGPARAVRAACAIRDEVRRIGIDIRAGLHTGECEVTGEHVRGIAVHTGARVAAAAGAGDVLVSSTVK